MRTASAVVVLLMLAGPAFAQQTILSGVADQSWMLNPGNRGESPLDHGTLAGLSTMWLFGRRAAIELAVSVKDIRPRELMPGQFYQGRIAGSFGGHFAYFFRPHRSAARVRPYFAVGGGILRLEQTTSFPPFRPHTSRENAFPLVVGGGVMAFVMPRVVLRADVRLHPAPEEQMVRLLVGAGYVFGTMPPERRGSPTPASSRAPGPQFEVIAGYVPFFDDSGILPHLAVGAGARWYVTSGVAVGPEIHVMDGPGVDRDSLLTGSAAFDLRAATSPSGARHVVPYLIANGGLLHHRGRFRSATGPVLSFGGGVRIPLRRRLYLSPEYRIGLEPQMRFTVAIGWRPKGE